jgi:WD40 repeat protein
LAVKAWPMRCVAFSPGGSTLAVLSHSNGFDGSENALQLWETASGRRLVKVATALGKLPLGLRLPHCLAFSPDGESLALGYDGGDVRLVEVASGKDRRWLKGSGQHLFCLAFRPDGKALAVGGQHAGYPAEKGKPWRTWPLPLYDPASGKLRRELPVSASHVLSLAFNPEGTTLAAAEAKGGTRLWAAGTWHTRRRLRQANGWVFSPDGKLLAGTPAGEAASVALWEVSTGQEVARFAGHQDAVAALAFSPDGKRLTSAAKDRTALVWDLLAPPGPPPGGAGWGKPARLWQDLGKPGAAGYRATAHLARSPAVAR